MSTLSMGAVTVPSNGTPVQLVINVSAIVAQQPLAHAILVQPLPTNTGKCYVGNAANFIRNSTGQLAWLGVPTANSAMAFSITISYAPNGLNLTEYYVDVDVNGEGVVASAVID